MLAIIAAITDMLSHLLCQSALLSRPAVDISGCSSGLIVHYHK
ncbi:hypothetical protein [Morganella morganii]|nr:hypothetical protein [Morganella morganii]